MAIQVNGTTVIDDSRNMVNVGGFKTVNGTSVVGSGDISAGASTTFNTVGTYTYGRPMNTTTYGGGSTASGVYGVSSGGFDQGGYFNNYSGRGSYTTALSGTWRCMGIAGNGLLNIWVRIS